MTSAKKQSNKTDPHPLVIVESPTKVKTIHRILGPDYKIVSTMGHVIDLPPSSFGVDVERDFTPKWIVLRSKQKVFQQLKKEVNRHDTIYVATDPDREGEAIGYNIITHTCPQKGPDVEKTVKRVTFQEITPSAVKQAFAAAREFDEHKIKAQWARRILDRIVGYKISPLLWKKIGSRLSAGRVQSVALRLIVEREREIDRFVPKEYWQITAILQKEGLPHRWEASLEKINGEKPDLSDKEAALKVAEDLKRQDFLIGEVKKRKVSKRPPPPFTTSSLQQEAFNKLRFNAERTMRLAQRLYEGVELAGGETVGLITYMRTDSVRVSKEAVDMARRYLKEHHADALPETPHRYTSKKGAQEAHEAIRPTDVSLTPERVKPFLESDLFKLYDLIWRRFLASQMKPAVFEQTRIVINAGPYQLALSGQIRVFDGYLRLWDRDETEEKEAKENPPLDCLATGDRLRCIEVKPTQHFTKPPARYSDASLVRTLEEKGIGRPSTYASILRTLIDRRYAVRQKGYFHATELGMKVCDLLIEAFPRIMDVGFTAQMEEALDEIEEGQKDHIALLKDFYGPFIEDVQRALTEIKKEVVFVDKTCPQCGRPLAVKWGRRGQFLSCSGFPACRYAETIHTGVPCPEKGCDGFLVERRSRRGVFYGCSRYPRCTHISNRLPQSTDEADVVNQSVHKADKTDLQTDQQ